MMKSKLIFAAVVAPLLFASVPSSAFAAPSVCSAASGGNVSCDSFDLGITAAALNAAGTSASEADAVASFWNASGLNTVSILTSMLTGYTGSYSLDSFNAPFLGIATASANTFTVSDPLPSYISNLVTSITRGFNLQFQLLNGVITSGTVTPTYLATSAIFKVGGTEVNLSSGGPLNASAISLNTAQFTAVPGPEAGAGIGALAMGGMAFWMKRRRKDQALAA